LANASIKKIKERRIFTMEMENKYASRGVGGTALGLAIGSLGLQTLNGGLGGILGGGAKTTCDKGNGGDAAILASYFSAMNNLINNAEHRCGDGYVTSKEAALTREIADRDSKIGLLESNIYTDGKIADVYEKLNAKIAAHDAQINAQAVYNATLNGTVGCIQGQIAQLMALTKTVISAENICPVPMPQYNSWTAPTTTTGA
jgi:hypothetical protein